MLTNECLWQANEAAIHQQVNPKHTNNVMKQTTNKSNIWNNCYRLLNALKALSLLFKSLEQAKEASRASKRSQTETCKN